MPDQQFCFTQIVDYKPRSVFVQCNFTVTSDESVELEELSLVLHTSFLEKKPSLSLLSIES